MEDKQIQCADCGRSFTLTVGEQEFFQQRGMSEPKRCKECREARRAGRESGGQGGRGGRGR
jgi:hypothetical protein